MGSEPKPTVLERKGSGAPASDAGDDAPVEAGPRYANRDEIARGGMGRVVEAADTMLGRVVAIKEALSTDPDVLRRFARETRITARLEHPSIVPVYDAGHSASGEPFYVMRKVSGRPLEQLVDGARTLPQRLALLPHVLATAQAVAHAHRRGILHRDLKPSNILIGDLGETVVIDWGLAKVIGEVDPEGEQHEQLPATVDAGQSLRTRVGVVFGTPGFMAPEQVRGEAVDERADVYALGATLYFLLARAVPHEAASGDDMMVAAASGPPVPLRSHVAGIPPDLLTIVDKALAFRAQDRYPDAGAVAEDLQRFLEGQLVASHHYRRRERVVRFVRRHRVAVSTVGLAVAALLIGGIFSVRRIVAERDRADDQAQLATKQQHDAEDARQRESERADQLVVEQARALVETNPARAVGLLKALRTPAARWDRLWRYARGIVARARSVGVPWSMPGPQQPIQQVMSPSGTHAFVVGGDGEIWTYDLVAHRGKLLASTAEHRNAAWVTDAKLLIFRDRAVALVDEATGTQTPIAVPVNMTRVECLPRHCFFLDSDHTAWRLDPDTLVVTKLRAHAFEIRPSPDGRWLVVVGDTDVVLYDLQAEPFAIRSFPTDEVWFSVAWSHDSTRLAIAGRKHAAVIEPARAGPAIPFTTGGMMLQVGFAQHRLVVHDQEYGLMWGGADTRLKPAFVDMIDVVSGIGLVGDTQLGVVSRGHVIVFGIDSRTDIPVPTVGVVRLATRHGSPLVFAATPGRALVWDMRTLRAPYLGLTDVTSFTFGSDHDLLVTRHGELHWVDLDAKTDRALGLPPLLLQSSFIRSDTLVLYRGDGPGWITHRQDIGVTPLPFDAIGIAIVTASESVLANTLPGALVEYDPSTKRVTTYVSRPVPIDTIAANKGWVAALFADGLLWREELATGKVTTLQLAVSNPPIARSVTVALDTQGAIYAPADRTIVRWSADGSPATELASLPSSIVSMSISSTIAIAGTHDQRMFVADLDKPAPARAAIPSGSANISSSLNGGLAIYTTPDGKAYIADLVIGESWPLLAGSDRAAYELAQISPDGTHVGAVVAGTLTYWSLDLPEDAASTAAWLDALTNATTVPGTTSLAWE